MISDNPSAKRGSHTGLRGAAMIQLLLLALVLIGLVIVSTAMGYIKLPPAGVVKIT